jgi:probable F420-dependent oxidoreductase
MRFGYLSYNAAAGPSPASLAHELEARGFDSVWLPEHSHIPASRETPYPGGGDLPEGYLHMMNPFVSLAAAATATTDLLLATGICLALEHDLLDLGSQTTTLDVLSGGRLLLGVGVGWNREELANHRPDVSFGQRYDALEERIAALRAIWGDDLVSFDGRWEHVTPSWVYPKPVGGTVTVAVGCAGPRGMRLAAEQADHWCPIDADLHGEDGHIDVALGVRRFRELAELSGRDVAAIPVSVFTFGRPSMARLERYAAAGVDRIVLPSLVPVVGVPSEAEIMRQLDELAPLIEAAQEMP